MAGGRGGVAPQGSELTELLAAVRTFSERPDRHLSPGRLAQELIQRRHACDRLEVEFSLSAARFAATDEYQAQGSITAIDWIRHECRMSGHAAAERVWVGGEVERLPQSIEALEAGRIGFAHLALMARTSSALHQSASTQGFDESALLASATALSVGRFRNV